MTQEEKSLLLKDLCARFPYGVKVNHIKEEYGNINDLTGILDSREVYIDGAICDISDIKPYLRPMSSMTDEERNNLRAYCRTQEEIIYDVGVSGAINSPAIIDFLNAHHFDYRGLIEKSLALEAPEGMYK